jgi:hypothetical protein
VIGVYLKKTSGYFTFGGEFSWLSGNATDGNGNVNDLSAIAALVNGVFDYHNIKGFLEVLYAGGDSDLTNTQQTGFMLLNRNRRPGLILGREIIGQYHGNNVNQGSLVYYGAATSFSGVIYIRPGFRWEWSPSWASGVELIYAQKAAVQVGESANLGIEIDVGTEYNIYKNLQLGVNGAYLFAGNGLLTSGTATNAYAVRSTVSLKF